MSFKTIYKSFFILSILFLAVSPVFAQTEYPKAPDNFEEAKDFVFQIIKNLPNPVEKAWKQALGLWQKMLGFFNGLWENKVAPWFGVLLDNITGIFHKELKKQEEKIEKGIDEEKEEIKKEILNVEKGFWEKIRNFFR